jgi:hypothetical protein
MLFDITFVNWLVSLKHPFRNVNNGFEFLRGQSICHNSVRIVAQRVRTIFCALFPSLIVTNPNTSSPGMGLQQGDNL